ncbi:hypothetical protein C8R46DRAFT_1121308 [Mycena filopes]|nr:hypothetical protein C8R46DRAFT_1121308 [Mycena filopes]
MIRLSFLRLTRHSSRWSSTPTADSLLLPVPSSRRSSTSASGPTSTTATSLSALYILASYPHSNRDSPSFLDDVRTPTALSALALLVHRLRAWCPTLCGPRPTVATPRRSCLHWGAHDKSAIFTPQASLHVSQSPNPRFHPVAIVAFKHCKPGHSYRRSQLVFQAHCPSFSSAICAAFGSAGRGPLALVLFPRV